MNSFVVNREVFGGVFLSEAFFFELFIVPYYKFYKGIGK